MKLKLGPVIALEKKEMVDDIITPVTYLRCKLWTRNKFNRNSRDQVNYNTNHVMEYL